MKRNIDDFDGMKDFIISIATVIAWVLIGTIIAIGYFAIDKKGDSIILSWISTIFTIISSLGIIASVTIYLLQKSNDNKKQIEIDMKLFHFIEIKAFDLVSKLDKVLHLVENENEYMHIRIENGGICYSEILEDQNIAYCKIDLKISNKNDFLDRHGVQASLDLFKFIIEIDSLSEEFINKTSWYITYGHEYIGNYIPEIYDNFQADVERSLLIDFLNKTKDTIKLKLNKFSIR